MRPTGLVHPATRLAIAALSTAWLAGQAVAGPPAPVDTLHDTDVMVDTALVRGTRGSVFVRVTAATGLREGKPVAGATVRIELERGKRHQTLGTWKTGRDGGVVARFDVPRLRTGDAKLRVVTRSEHGHDTVERTVRITDDTFVRLRTDRGVYKPGQRIRWRLIVLHGVDAHPVASAEAEVVIKDPRGTAIWRGRPKTDDAGMVIGDVPLGDDLVLGTYTLTASVAGHDVSETVRVRHFEMPPFFVTATITSPLPAPQGKPMTGRVVARYPYGEPVQGQVSVEAFGRAATLKLDEYGRADFELDVPGGARGHGTLVASVRDGAARSRTTRIDVPVRQDDLRVAVVPSASTFVAGQPHRVTVVTTDGAGRFVPARVSLLAPGEAKRTQKDSDGVALIDLKLRTGGLLKVNAYTKDGRVASASKRIAVRKTGRAAVISLPETLPLPGAPIVVRGAWPSRPGDHAAVVVTLTKAGTPVVSSVAEVDAQGRLTATIQPPPGLYGLMALRAETVGWDAERAASLNERAEATVFVRPEQLTIAIDGVGRFRPGEEAKLDVGVTHADGRPAVGVGLAASVVDERVLALDPPKTDLVELLEGRSVEKATLIGLRFASLVRQRGAREQAAARAILASLPQSPPRPVIEVDALVRWQKEHQRILQAQSAARGAMVRQVGAVGVRDGKAWRFKPALPDMLAQAGWNMLRIRTPWGRPTTWTYASELAPRWTFEAEAPRITRRRLEELARRLRARKRATHRRMHGKSADEALAALVEGGVVEPWMTFDAWGGEVVVRRRLTRLGEAKKWTVDLLAPGPDGKLGTADDARYADVYQEGLSAGGGMGYYGSGAGGGGFGLAGRGAGKVYMRGASSGGPMEVAIRKRFDETVLWAAGIRTDKNGRAPLEVQLADSITGWELEIEAVGPKGAVGAAKARLETFLPMYADAQVPAALTVGDRYELPVVLANHTAQERTLEAHVDVRGPLALDGDVVQRLTLPAGATGVVAFPLKATGPGDGTLALRVREGGRDVDASERTIRVEAAGRKDRMLVTGQVEDGRWKATVQVSEDAEPGTVEGILRVFRGALDQATDGLEGMLREPHGCFEQTSSTTYPNLLVLDLMKGDRDADPAVLGRARDLVARGYQRLISYEVTGGGFSWFGSAPANRVLTAYGLMEFVDMARVYPVDPQLIERTRRWLLGEQSADGSWSPDKSWLHDWSAVQGKVSTTAWIAWALAETGYRGKQLDKALRFLRRHRRALSDNPYLLALWSAAETRAGGAGRRALAALDKHRQSDPRGLRFGAGGKTLFYTQGVGADVQVTALATMAFQRKGDRAVVKDALGWLWSNRTPSYGWGNTQGTVLSLRAAALAARGQAPPEAGTLAVRLDGRRVGAIDLASEGVPSVALPEGLKAGRHELSIEGDVAASLLADLRIGWRERSAPKPVASGLEVALKTPEEPVRVGRRGRFELAVKNPSAEAVPMPTVVVPVPPGWRTDAQQLRGLAVGDVAKVEDQGTAIYVYLTKLAPGAEVKLAYDLEAAVACDVTQRGPSAYAYYDPNIRGSAGNVRVQALPREPTTANR